MSTLDAEWIVKLAAGSEKEFNTLLDVIALETLVDEMVPELSMDEQVDLAHIIKDAAVKGNVTIGDLVKVNAYVADKYLTQQADLLKASVIPTHGSIIVGDRIFSRSSNEFGKVLRIIKAKDKEYTSAEKVYETKYGLQASRKGATTLYQVSHDDGAVELYYDTEVVSVPVPVIVSKTI